MPSEGAKVVATTAVGQRHGVWARWRNLPRPQRLRLAGCAGYLLLLTLLFLQPLTRLMVYAAKSPLDSYILIVPVICGYLLYIERGRCPATYRTSIPGTLVMLGVAIAALTARIGWRDSLSLNDGLTLMALAFVCFVAAGGFLFLGAKWMAAAAFPVAFLVFLVPLPGAAVNWLEIASARASASTAQLFFQIAGVPVSQDGVLLSIPGMTLEVANECSGIHSSWVLFICSLLTSHLFLKTRWRKIVLVAFVIPLGILRNGFRILVIGLLCVYVGPYMINSPIHHRGGPLFFALSLIPLFILLWWLWHQERRLNLTS